MDKSEINKKLDEIESLKKEYNEKICNLNEELLGMAIKLDNYYDIYCFIKSICRTQEEFNMIMMEIRDEFVDHNHKKIEDIMRLF